MKPFKFLTSPYNSVKDIITRGIRNCSTFNIKFSNYEDYYIERGVEKHIRIDTCVERGFIVEVYFHIITQIYRNNSWETQTINHILNLRKDEFMELIGGSNGYRRFLRRESQIESQF